MYAIGDEFSEGYPPEAAEWCNQNGCWLREEPEGSGRYRIVPWMRDEPETPEQMQARYARAAQDALDAFAGTRGYDGILSACSYAGSADEQFVTEARYCVELRDATWRRAFAIFAAVLAGTMEMPSVGEFLSMLPVSGAAWPPAP